MTAAVSVLINVAFAPSEPLISEAICAEPLTKVFPNSDSAVLILVENEPLSVFRFVTLVEKLELAAVKEPVISVAI